MTDYRFTHILLLEENASRAQLISEVLEELGYRVSLAPEPSVARHALDGGCVGLLIATVDQIDDDAHIVAKYASTFGIPQVIISRNRKIEEIIHPDAAAFLCAPFTLERLGHEVVKSFAGRDGPSDAT